MMHSPTRNWNTPWRLVRSFDDAVQNARQAGKRKLRWPVEEVVIVTAKEDVKGAVVRLNEVCKDRANARRVTVVMGRWDRIGWHAEPVMKALGKGFGRDSFKVKGLIEAADGNAIKMAVDAGQTFTLTSGSAAFEIGAEHVTFTEKLPVGIFSAPMEDATVYVDVALTPELEAEGYAREVIRRIQEMRPGSSILRSRISFWPMWPLPTSASAGLSAPAGRPGSRTRSGQRSSPSGGMAKAGRRCTSSQRTGMSRALR